MNSPRIRLDIDRAIDHLSGAGDNLQTAPKKPDLISLLMDIGGSCEVCGFVPARLFQAVTKNNQFKDLKISTSTTSSTTTVQPDCAWGSQIGTEWVPVAKMAARVIIMKRRGWEENS